ncbi:MAG: DsrE family protein [Actinomycetota bacterium]|nr:DsrE family protein [Actinomycetota bacterium]
MAAVALACTSAVLFGGATVAIRIGLRRSPEARLASLVMTAVALAGLGTGSLRESYDAIVAAGGRFYLSGMSSKARGVAEGDLEGKPAEMATPNVLVRLALEHDRVLTY